jgi:DNA topoisomerase I
MKRITVDVRFLDDWSEADHPRGQPENKGEFASTGGAGSSASTAKGLPGKTTLTDGKRTQHDGKPLPAHIQALRIPPAWTDVSFSHDPNAPLQATGKDVKGRSQYVYSPKFSASQAEAKFVRIKELDAKFKSIEAQNNKLRQSTDPRVKDNADCAHLIMQTGIRPGSRADTLAKVKAYGATTLEGKHVVVKDGKVWLRFTGKKGVALDLPVQDPETAKMLVSRAKAAGANGALFGRVTDKSLLDHVHGFDGGSFKTKDFRTLLGTKTANKEVARMKAPTDAKTYKKSVMDVAKVVSQRLGNTPVIALQAYISPTVFAPWQGALAA